MKLSTLPAWLDYLGSVSRKNIELGLKRVSQVADYLDLLNPQPLVITVAGTNGKGSTVATLAAIYQQAGFKVGTFTSPYLERHNEEVCINGEQASDEAFCEAFNRIEEARGEVRLTPFEFHTLAALSIFKQHSLDILILEIGLGGRLDAVNIIAADVAIITSIAIDHVEWLGPTREHIGREKAGIFREKQLAVCGDKHPPQSLLAHAKCLQVHLACQGHDFNYLVNPQTRTWDWTSNQISYANLPMTHLQTENISTALMTITLLQNRLTVTENHIRTALKSLRLAGRQEWIIHKNQKILLDVAHNPHAASALAAYLDAIDNHPKEWTAVFTMLGDKDIQQCIRLLKSFVHEWYIAALPDERAASVKQLRQAFDEVGVDEKKVIINETIEQAFEQALKMAKRQVLVFGSFYAVGRIKKYLHSPNVIKQVS